MNKGYSPENLTQELEKDFLNYLEKGYEVLQHNHDNRVTIQLYKDYIDVLSHEEHFGSPVEDLPYFFRPSNTDVCLTELWCTVNNIPKDSKVYPTYQKRWQNIGTRIGDMIQEDILQMEAARHNDYVFMRNKDGYHMFEQFSTTVRYFNDVILAGSVDGILYSKKHDLRIGLEIKSKQTSYSATSQFSMRKPNGKHVKQVTSYAILHDLDYYFIVYQNCSKNNWNMGKVAYEKYPDLRVFCIHITKEMKENVLNNFSYIYSLRDLPVSDINLDLTKWTFHNYKQYLLPRIDLKYYVPLAYKLLESDWVSKFDKNSINNFLEDVKRFINE